MKEWLEAPNCKFELRYRGSDDGWTTDDYFSKCENVENALVLCKSSKGFRFGGFRTLPIVK